jgi:hypothetical protein
VLTAIPQTDMFFLPTIIEAFLTFYEEDDGKDSTRNILGARPFV